MGGYTWPQIFTLLLIVVVACFIANRFTTYKAYDQYGNAAGTSKPGVGNPVSSSKRAPGRTAKRSGSGSPMRVAA